MSIQDHVAAALGELTLEPDPIQRLKMIHSIQTFIAKELRKAKREAAYKSRLLHSSRQLEDMTGIYRKDIDYLLRRYMDDNPHAEQPKWVKHDLSGSIDLRGGIRNY